MIIITPNPANKHDAPFPLMKKYIREKETIYQRERGFL